MPTIPEALATATAHHQAGRLQAAEELYRQILRADPNQPDALHLLGLIAHQSGNHEAAAELIERSIRVNGAMAESHYNLAKVQQALNRIPEAISSYRRAVEINPSLAGAHNNLGNILRKQGELAEAVACFRRALALKPDYTVAHNNLGNGLLSQGKLDEAVASYQQALTLNPAFAEAHNNLSRAFRAQGKLEDAVACARRALDLEPALAAAHNNLGLALSELGQPVEAAGCWRRALELAPDLADAHYNLGRARRTEGNLEEAVACYRRAVALMPSLANHHNSLGIALGEQGKLEESAACFRRALELAPELTEAHHNLGNVFMELGALAEAVACWRCAVELDPGFAIAHHNLGIYLLLLGRFEEGWREYEYRLACTSFPRKLSQPRWHGEPAAGRTILIHSEQGFGDMLQLIRYAPLVRPHAGAAHVILETPPALTRLFLQNGPWDAEIVPNATLAECALPPFDCYVPLLSLPLALGLPEPLGMSGPYLRADPALRREWRERLGAGSALRVGLVWAGNSANKRDLFRSMRAESFLPLLHLPAIQFYSLQTGPPSSQAEALQAAGLIDLTECLIDFAETAALVAELDLVITVDTSVAHLAGAMGCPVWTLLPSIPDWRWGLEGESTPWYPTMRLFRQSVAGDWEGVLQRVADELAKPNATAPRARRSTELDPAPSHARGTESLPAAHAQAEANYQLGRILKEQGKLAEAVASYRRALALEPEAAQTHNSLGVALGKQGKPAEAAACFRRALELQPGFAEAHSNLGNALREQGELAEAIACCRRALALDPDSAETLDNLGLALIEQGQQEEAEAPLRRAAELKPDFAGAQVNLANALKEQGKVAEAVACYRRALALKPDLANAHNNLGLALNDQGNPEEAIACCRRAVELTPEFTMVRNNLAILLLLLGRYEEGWREYEHRFGSTVAVRKFSKPRWHGERAEGQTILIHSEQGFGDALQFVRYAPLVRARSGAARVILETQLGLARLFTGNQSLWDIEIAPGVATDEALLPPFDYQVPLLSLPLALGIAEPLTMTVPYLHADLALRLAWRERLGPGSTLRIGIVWAGNPENKKDRFRSLRADSLLSLLQVPGIQFYSLQTGPPRSQALPLQAAGLIDLTSHLTDFADTAAFVAELDLVISVDTAVAHLAGALGRPVWILVPAVPDWRWGAAGESTPWYPTMRLFRQSQPGDWAPVLALLSQELATLII